MNFLTINELQEVQGGSFKVIAALVAGGIFLIGVLDGFLRPYSCRK